MQKIMLVISLCTPNTFRRYMALILQIWCKHHPINHSIQEGHSLNLPYLGVVENNFIKYLLT